MSQQPQLQIGTDSSFRIFRLQVFNWGTFSGRHDIPISERGFLFVGRSGAGKSTLLDAISSLLVPPRWIDFNAAAREAEKSGRDRSLASYVRGAWAEQKEEGSGEIAVQYLRPGTTWSALALSYRNGAGQIVVLAQLFWMRGKAAGTTDVKRQNIILERDFDLRELESFANSDFDLRKLKQDLPEAFIRDEFQSYCERFSRILGIESELALRLLHKTQSAKNLGDLNTFLRDFMLDKPTTFEVAERLVEEFSELNAAHQAVVTAREQVQTLVPAREAYESILKLRIQSKELNELQDKVNVYATGLRSKLLSQHVADLEIQVESRAGNESQCQALHENESAALRDLERRHRETGGDQIEHLESEKVSLERQRDERLRKREHMQEACRGLGWSVPDSASNFAAIFGDARQEAEDWVRQNSESRENQIRLAGQKAQAEEVFKGTIREVKALERQSSNIRADLLEVREKLAKAIGVSEAELPFVAELIEVKPTEKHWQGAIERVLGGFAHSLLVDERNYAALSKQVNDTHWGERLFYNRTTLNYDSRQVQPLSSGSLVLKLNLNEKSEHVDWLRTELRQRFDYACVDTVQALRNFAKAVTLQGQIKHSQSRHEKDDRHSIDNRRNWVLGFDNREKLAAYQELAHIQAEAIAKLQAELDALSKQDETRVVRARHCQTLVTLNWQEVDVAPLMERIAAVERQVAEIRSGNVALQELGKQIQRQKKAFEQAEKNLVQAKSEHHSLRSELEKNQRKLAAVKTEHAKLPELTPQQHEGLEGRFAKLAEPTKLDNLGDHKSSVVAHLAKEIQEIVRHESEDQNTVEKSFEHFARRWSADTGGLDPRLASAEDFFARLDRLEKDGLPAHEQRFFDLLQNQSHQNLVALSTHLQETAKAILARMELVNDSLKQVPFNQTADQKTYLQIDVSNRQLPEVGEFKQEIRAALGHAWDDDRESAESRFLTLRKLVERLASQDPVEKRWRETVLDVRMHVEFVGRETDAHGVDVQMHRGGGGKSGGQRQKLAMTCLAAALRYQLGGGDAGAPQYAAVILDEAFDKADNEFTTLCMKIFEEFGFQMIVATPLKSVMTLEPFIGGACFVDIRDRSKSSVLLIPYDEERSRLKLPERARKEADLETT